jgi:hypothetical protein
MYPAARRDMPFELRFLVADYLVDGVRGQPVA